MRTGYRHRAVYHPEDELEVFLFFHPALWGGEAETNEPSF